MFAGPKPLPDPQMHKQLSEPSPPGIRPGPGGRHLPVPQCCVPAGPPPESHTPAPLPSSQGPLGGSDMPQLESSLHSTPQTCWAPAFPVLVREPLSSPWAGHIHIPLDTRDVTCATGPWHRHLSSEAPKTIVLCSSKPVLHTPPGKTFLEQESKRVPDLTDSLPRLPVFLDVNPLSPHYQSLRWQPQGRVSSCSPLGPLCARAGGPESTALVLLSVRGALQHN